MPIPRYQRCASKQHEELHMANATERRLWNWTRRFSCHFSANNSRELLLVESSLQNPARSPEDRRRALIFSMYQLLLNGGVSEHNIQHYQSAFPDFLRAELSCPMLQLAVVAAWKGSAYTPNRSNILGAVAFMVVLLFFLESCCAMVLNDDDPHLKRMLEALRQKGDIDEDSFDALVYLAEFRNVWHNFGVHNAKKARRGYNSPQHSALTFPDLIPGKTVQPLGEAQTLHLMDKVLTVFCKLAAID
jgi:hypothetical protein